jgi:hypothetical protein
MSDYKGVYKNLTWWIATNIISIYLIHTNKNKAEPIEIATTLSTKRYWMGHDGIIVIDVMYSNASNISMTLFTKDSCCLKSSGQILLEASSTK